MGGFAGRPVLVLDGAGVDHRETEACFEPVFEGFRRIYPDLPGMGRTVATEGLRSAEDVLDTLLGFAAARAPGQVAGLALVCPLLPDVRDVPERRVVVGSGEIGDDDFRSYFVLQTPQMLERYEGWVRRCRGGAAGLDRRVRRRRGPRGPLPARLARRGRWALTSNPCAPSPTPRPGIRKS